MPVSDSVEEYKFAHATLVKTVMKMFCGEITKVCKYVELDPNGAGSLFVNQIIIKFI